MELCVIVPVHNGGADLMSCLNALAASTRRPDELIVVDDSSTDGSSMVASQFSAQVLTLAGGPYGPAAARNRGAAAASGHVLVFLDADVAVHPDTLARIEAHMVKESDVAALFGSYDDRPPARGLVSRYKNLLHHYVHQHGRREASTFWAGCGAIRREVFFAVGGFDESYHQPSIEDIELGTRLRQAGYRIILCPDVQVTHLKRWTFAGLLRSDIRDRAIPWTRVILRTRHLPADLNLDAGSRLSALTAWIALLLFIFGFWLHGLWAGAIIAFAGLCILNADLYRFFARHGGIGFLAGAVVLHVLYYLYSSLVFALLVIAKAWRSL